MFSRIGALHPLVSSLLAHPACVPRMFSLLPRGLRDRRVIVFSSRTPCTFGTRTTPHSLFSPFSSATPSTPEPLVDSTSVTHRGISNTPL